MKDPQVPEARGLDTNVLLRYFIDEDPKQHARSVRRIEDELTPEAPGLVAPVMLCELVWALRTAYKVPKRDVVAVLRLVMRTPTPRVLDRPTVAAALDPYEVHSADFADCLLHVRYQEEGTALSTFDVKASRLPDAERLVV